MAEVPPSAARAVVAWGLLAAGLSALAIAGTRRARHLAVVRTDLRTPLLLAPSMSRIMLPLFRLLQTLVSSVAAPEIRTTEHWARARDGAAVRIVTSERRTAARPRPALVWLHGGGYVCGIPEQDAALLARVLAELDILIVAIDYRLAPEHPFPAALDDAYAGLTWLVDQAGDLGVDPDRIAVGGQSAGGGLAAALAQRAIDQGPIAPSFQLLAYPMLDAVTVSRRDGAGHGRFVWTPASNRFAWRSYLGAVAETDAPIYASPSTREDLTGLPPAWIGVGTLDLFQDEDVDHGRRLQAAGVPCATYIVEGAYHGFDALRPGAATSRRFQSTMIAALGRALRPREQEPSDTAA